MGLSSLGNSIDLLHERAVVETQIRWIREPGCPFALVGSLFSMGVLGCVCGVIEVGTDGHSDIPSSELMDSEQDGRECC